MIRQDALDKEIAEVLRSMDGIQDFDEDLIVKILLSQLLIHLSKNLDVAFLVEYDAV